MRYLTPALIFILAVTIGFFSVYGGDSYGGLKALKRSFDLQQQKNARKRSYVHSLRRRIFGLEQDARMLEKAARNELSMARPHELIFIFEDEDFEKKENR